MKKSKYKIGERVLCKGGYHAYIIEVKKDWFGFKYICTWNAHDFDYNYRFKKSGVKRSWQILCVN